MPLDLHLYLPSARGHSLTRGRTRRSPPATTPRWASPSQKPMHQVCSSSSSFYRPNSSPSLPPKPIDSPHSNSLFKEKTSINNACHLPVVIAGTHPTCSMNNSPHNIDPSQYSTNYFTLFKSRKPKKPTRTISGLLRKNYPGPNPLKPSQPPLDILQRLS